MAGANQVVSEARRYFTTVFKLRISRLVSFEKDSTGPPRSFNIFRAVSENMRYITRTQTRCANVEGMNADSAQRWYEKSQASRLHVIHDRPSENSRVVTAFTPFTPLTCESKNKNGKPRASAWEWR